MATDYTSNSKKSKEPDGASVPPKNVEKVIATTVIVPKKTLGRKFRDLFIAADFRTVVKFVGTDVLLPAAKAMIFDAMTMGSKRMIYGERDARRLGRGLMI